MQTTFPQEFLDTPDGREADRILRSCVHCGFCTATCPTFLETGNELDSPRGRIYLVKQMLETGQASSITRIHLDRCLTCQSCETTCPSNVNYHGLLNIGRRVMEQKVRRPLWWQLKSGVLRLTLTTRWLFATALWFGRLFAALFPGGLRKILKKSGRDMTWDSHSHDRKMLVLNGCVQEGLTPDVNAAASRVFSRLGISLVTAGGEGCCGAMAFHLNAQKQGLEQARRKTDILCKALDEGAEAIISSASGCGNFIHQYADLLREDKDYAGKAARVSAATRDISAVLADEDLTGLALRESRKVAFHCPCTLQHGLGLGGATEQLLFRLGFDLAPVREGHICCGSAGAYSVMEPELSGSLRKRKLEALGAGSPDTIVTANIGCQLHLGQAADKPVEHWIVLLDELLA